MLIFDFRTIGSKLFLYRKREGMTQLGVATAAGIGERTYADIERGATNTSIETLLRICDVLNITPDAILTEENVSMNVREGEILERLNSCSPKEKDTALRLLEVYFKSLGPDESE